MVGGSIDDWKFFLFMGIVDGWIFFWLRIFFSYFVAVGGVDSDGF